MVDIETNTLACWNAAAVLQTPKIDTVDLDIATRSAASDTGTIAGWAAVTALKTTRLHQIR